MKLHTKISTGIFLVSTLYFSSYAQIGSQGMRQQVISLTDICTNQFSVIESEITTSGFTIVESQLQGIESKLDTCCSQCESKLAAISTNNNGLTNSIATIESSLDELGNKFDTCCSTIDSQLDVIESKVDVVDADLQVLSASNLEQIIKNLSAIDTMASDIDQTLSKMNILSSSIFENLSDLNGIMSGVSTQLSTIDSNMSTCATQLDSQLDRIESTIDTQINPMSSQISTLGSKLSVCCTQLDSQLDRIESKIDRNDSTMTSQLTSISSKVSACATQLDSQLDRIESKIDRNDSAMTSQINAIDSKLAVCCTQLDSQLDRIESKIDNFNILVSIDLSPIISTLDTCATQIDSQLDRIESKIDTADTSIINQLASIDSKVSVCCTQLDSQLDRIESKIDLPSPCATTPITTSTTLSVAGAYRLANNISGDVAITGSNITLDLAGRTISGGTYGITISGNNVTVKNGTIQNATTANIYLTGSNCLLEDCNLVGSVYGLRLLNGMQNRLSSCCATGNTLAGFSLVQSFTNNIISCKTMNTSGSTNTFGFISTNGSENVFESCKAETVVSTSTASFGFYIADQADKLLANDVFGVQSAASSAGQGITLPSALNLFFNTGYDYGTEIQSVKWSPNGRYLAAGVQIYAFDGLALTYVATTTISIAATIYSVDWSPNGQYLAIGTNTGFAREIAVFSFDGTSLNYFTTPTYNYSSSQPVYAVNWSPDGQYLAVGGLNPTSGLEAQVFSFNSTLSTLTFVTGYYYGPTGYPIYSLNWSPNGQYLAITGIHGSGHFSLEVLTFNGISLTFKAAASGSSEGHSVQWAPDSHHIAIGYFGDSIAREIFIYFFNGSSLSLVTSYDWGIFAQTVNSLSWSPNGQYLAAGGVLPSTNNYAVQTYSFNGTASTLIFQSTYNFGAQVDAVNWSPNGYYLAAGGTGPVNGLEAQVYNVTYPAINCVVQNNLVTDVHSVSGSLGAGYSVNACTNLFMNNIGYNNDTNTVFTSTCSGVDIYSQLDLIASKLDQPACSITPITAAGTISTAGSYYLANNISGSLVITGTNITLDLSGYTISPTYTGIYITGSNVAIKNGLINGGIYGIILNGASQCMITTVTCNGQRSGNTIFLSNGSNNNKFINDLISNVTLGGVGVRFDGTSHYNSFIGCTIDNIQSIAGVVSNAYAFVGNGTGMVIDRCLIKNLFGLASSAVVAGLRINGAQSWIITRNIFANLVGTPSRTAALDSVDAALTNCIVSNNMITTVTATTGGVFGIVCNGDTNCAFINNMVSIYNGGTPYSFASTASYNNQANPYN